MFFLINFNYFCFPNKQATGLTGLVVSTNPHHTLTSLYGKILRALSKMPENASYRNYTEKVVTERAKIVANVGHMKYYSTNFVNQIDFYSRHQMLVKLKIKSVAAR